MSVDLVSVIVRAGLFVGLFQAAGAAIFLALFGDKLKDSSFVRRLAVIAAAGGVLLIVAHQLLEAARMADDYAGMLDANLRHRALASSGGATHALQLIGLVLIAFGLRRDYRRGIAVALGGAALAILAFLLTGHTSVHAQRWLLAPLLALHLSVVAFWFGALAPLYWVTTHEPLACVVSIMEKFSAIAGWLVPGILIAGLALAALLAPDFSVLRRPYGELLLAKFFGFALLMGLAALNRWRWVPALTAEQAPSRVALRQSIALEYLLVLTVLTVAAVLTTFYSPEH